MLAIGGVTLQDEVFATHFETEESKMTHPGDNMPSTIFSRSCE